MRVSLLSCVIAVAACITAQSSRPFTGTLPLEAHLDMAGAFTFMPDGELRLALAQQCSMDVMGALATYTVGECDRIQLDKIRVVAHTPWDQDIPGTWSDAGHIAFRMDWKATGLDPLADDAPAIAARPWIISGTQWSPSSAEVGAILKLIGDATETEIDLVRSGPPPKLEVATLAVDGDGLRAGHPSTLIVRIANHGSGPAYRVAATTRSSIEALHGLRLSFGSIKPGADKVRKLRVTVPASEGARDTMLVLEISEGNGVAPSGVSRRIPIAPSNAAPALAVQCIIEGRKVTRPDFDAGQSLTLRCAVDNTGDSEAKMVEIEAVVDGGAPTRSAPQAIAVSGHRAIDVPIVIPRTLPVDAPVEIAITARDRPSSRTAHTTIVGVVRKPKLCVRGQLTRAQYRAKVADLRSEVTAGVITQADFDRYDAELVTCLK
ncbi:MAG TPA: hypothetical protein VF469_08510 [Kofleriaceae bacterium]